MHYGFTAVSNPVNEDILRLDLLKINVIQMTFLVEVWHWLISEICQEIVHEEFINNLRSLGYVLLDKRDFFVKLCGIVLVNQTKIV